MQLMLVIACRIPETSPKEKVLKKSSSAPIIADIKVASTATLCHFRMRGSVGDVREPILPVQVIASRGILRPTSFAYRQKSFHDGGFQG